MSWSLKPEFSDQCQYNCHFPHSPNVYLCKQVALLLTDGLNDFACELHQNDKNVFSQQKIEHLVEDSLLEV